MDDEKKVSEGESSQAGETPKEEKKSNKLWVVALVTILAIFALGFLIRSQGKWLGEKLGSQLLSKTLGESVKVEEGGNKVSVKGEGGAVSVQNSGSLPDNFPKDFPVYANSKVSGSWTTSGEKGEGVSVVWESQDLPDTVASYFKSELPSAGWKITTSFNAEGSTTLSFEKDKVSGFMGITKGERDKTAISVTIGVK